MAFYFLSSTSVSDAIYYKPYISFKKNDGQMENFPNINNVNKQILDYWAERAAECVHPVMANRYADLVVDLYEQVVGKKHDNYYKLVCVVIDKTIEICNLKLLPAANYYDYLRKLKRALNLAKTVNLVKSNDKRLPVLKALTIEMDDCGDEAFEALVNDKYFTSIVEDDEIKKIVSKMEHITSIGYLLDSRGKKIVSLLAEYYINKGDEEKLLGGFLEFENCLRQDQLFKNEPIMRIAGLKDAHHIYSQFIGHSALTKECNQRIKRSG